MAASTAEPPAFSASMAISVASGCAVAAAPLQPHTADRVANGAPVTRSPPRMGVTVSMSAVSGMARYMRQLCAAREERIRGWPTPPYA